MRRVNDLPDNLVIRVPGGMSAPDGGSFHILHFDGAPYKQMCDGRTAKEDRHVGITAPKSMWCVHCLQAYMDHCRKHGYALHLAGFDTPGQYIVSYAPGMDAVNILDNISHQAGIKDRSVSVGDVLMDRFGLEIEALSVPYGFKARYIPDFVQETDGVYTPRAVIVADKPDYLFNWTSLVALAVENTVTFYRAWQKEIEVMKETNKQQWRPGQTWR